METVSAILNSVLNVVLITTVIFLAWLLMKGQRITHHYMKRVLSAVYEKVTEERAQELRKNGKAIHVYENDGEITITEEHVIHTCTQSSMPHLAVVKVMSADTDDDDDEDETPNPADAPQEQEQPQEQEATPVPSEDDEKEQPQKSE